MGGFPDGNFRIINTETGGALYATLGKYETGADYRLGNAYEYTTTTENPGVIVRPPAGLVYELWFRRTASGPDQGQITSYAVDQRKLGRWSVSLFAGLTAAEIESMMPKDTTINILEIEEGAVPERDSVPSTPPPRTYGVGMAQGDGGETWQTDGTYLWVGDGTSGPQLYLTLTDGNLTGAPKGAPGQRWSFR
ncbi:hypothetical protein ACIP5Y_25340 [Nocardia sp. NPDC088792]|uniref:hypothetical protein n=1 Tax=Nocardia sp. NPDC088792 TaxID=3364332 RepID=UPI0038107F74